MKRLGVGKILDSLASLKDRKLISLNDNGSFSITDVAKEILWSVNIPTWAKILRLLQIRSCSLEEIAVILEITKDSVVKDVEKLRQNQFVLMSPQRQEDRVMKIYEILPDGIEKIDKTEETGFNGTGFGEIQPKIEVFSIIEEVIREIKETQIEQTKKDSIITQLSKLKEKLEI